MDTRNQLQREARELEQKIARLETKSDQRRRYWVDEENRVRRQFEAGIKDRRERPSSSSIAAHRSEIERIKRMKSAELKDIELERAPLQKRLNAIRAEIREIESSCGPNDRQPPPKRFWWDLEPDVRDAIERVGITRDQFLAVLKGCWLDETVFCDEARRLEKSLRDSKQLREALRDRLQGCFSHR